MQERWMAMDAYPGYSISDSGLIRNDNTDRLIKRGPLSNGAPAVSLYVNKKYVRRQVSTFMSETWMAPPPDKWSTTIMHLDGDRDNCHIDNLVWRPRWFVIRYHRECFEPRFPDWNNPFRIVETGDVFDNPLECSLTYGVLQGDVFLALANSRPLFPGGFTLEWL